MTAASTPTAASEHDNRGRSRAASQGRRKSGAYPNRRAADRTAFVPFFGRQLQQPLRHPLRAIPCNRKKGFECCLKAFLLQISRIRKSIASPSQSAGTVRYGMPPSPAAPFHRKAAVGAFGRAPRCCNHADRQIPRFSCQLPFSLSAAAPRSSLQSGCPVPFCACRWYSCGEMPTARLNARENEE